jgi:hypothetical protein
MGSKCVLMLFLCPALLLHAADLKITTVSSAPGGSVLVASPGELPPHSPVTIFVHDNAQRTEFRGFVEAPLGLRGPAPHMAVITHCDTGVVDELDLDDHEYREFKMNRYPSEKEFAKELAQTQKGDQKHADFKTVDTGETRDFHGRVARHFITTITGKDREVNYRKVIDGWYLSLPDAGCAPEYLRQRHGSIETSTPIQAVGYGFPTLPALVNSGTVRSNLVYSWFLPTGLPVEEKTTQSQKIRVEGVLRDNTFELEQRVADFYEGPLPAVLFEVPSDFKKVRNLYQHRKR